MSGKNQGILRWMISGSAEKFGVGSSVFFSPVFTPQKPLGVIY